MRVRKLYIFEIDDEGRPSVHNSANGIFEKYSRRAENHEAYWYILRGNTVIEFKSEVKSQPLATEIVAEFGQTGAYIVSHASRTAVGGMSPVDLARKLTSISKEYNLPIFQQISFDSCSVAAPLKNIEALNLVHSIATQKEESLFVSYSLKESQLEVEMQTQQLTYISIFISYYARFRGAAERLKVKGWVSFISVADGQKNSKEMPSAAFISSNGNEGSLEYDVSTTGRKYINSGSRKNCVYKFVEQADRVDYKRQFIWEVKSENNKILHVSKLFPYSLPRNQS